ncbi:MAG: hypothetical protein M1370_09620 [Bacteroidetes bacterium]|nr:hypothetical protein [Bacteroidota bacterium]
MDVLLPLLSTVVSFTFAATVLSQYLSRRKPHQLVWCFGLVSYGIGTLTEFLVGIGIWNRAVYDAWYIFGAFYVAAYLGMGTVYLVAPRRIAHGVMAALGVLSLIAALLVLTANVDLTQIAVPGRLTGKAMPNYVRLLTPFFNVFGTVALVGGAAHSAWVFWRRRALPQRVVSNLLIAVGALLPAIGSSLLRFDVPGLFYIFEFLGVAVIFLGFLANYEIVASRLNLRAPASGSL